MRPKLIDGDLSIVVPAKAGTHERKACVHGPWIVPLGYASLHVARDTRDMRYFRVPAERARCASEEPGSRGQGFSSSRFWVPAFAGTTGLYIGFSVGIRRSALSRSIALSSASLNTPDSCSPVTCSSVVRCGQSVPNRIWETGTTALSEAMVGA